jgi:hypothetical protein
VFEAVDGGNTGVGGIVSAGEGRRNFVEVIGFLFARVSARLLLSVAPDFEREPKATRQRVAAD